MKLLIVVALLFVFGNAWSQAQPFPLSSDFSYSIEKEAYKKGLKNHSAIQPYLSYQLKVDSQQHFPSTNKSSSLWKLTSKHWLQGNKGKLSFYVNPLINANAGFQSQAGKKLGKLGAGLQLGLNYEQLSCFIAFSSNISGLPDFEEQHASTSMIVPGEGKAFSQNGNWFSHAGLTGYISWKPSQFFDIAAGRGKNFIGDGFRSLLLSDVSSPYNYVRLSAQVWRLRYMMLYQSMQDVDGSNISPELHSKFQVSHTLSVNISRNLNFYFFETVVSNAKDSLGNRGLELSYLNPFIFYRPVEFSMGSPDNVLLGFGGKILFTDLFSIYGQFALDEFIWSHLLKRDNWWGNKYGIQLGARYLDAFGIEGLSLQEEYNEVRPFTYSHDDPLSNYGNMYQPLAHPMGANFKEEILIVRYTDRRTSISLKRSTTIYGTDPLASTNGSDIYKSYENPDKVYGNVTGQGISHKLTCAELKYAYLVNPAWNLQLEASIGIRIHSSEGQTQRYAIAGIGLKTALFRNETGAIR